MFRGVEESSSFSHQVLVNTVREGFVVKQRVIGWIVVVDELMIQLVGFSVEESAHGEIRHSNFVRHSFILKNSRTKHSSNYIFFLPLDFPYYPGGMEKLVKAFKLPGQRENINGRHRVTHERRLNGQSRIF